MTQDFARCAECAVFHRRRKVSFFTFLNQLRNNELDTAKLFHPVILGILFLENNDLNGSDISAVLATQNNNYEYARVLKKAQYEVEALQWLALKTRTGSSTSTAIGA